VKNSNLYQLGLHRFKNIPTPSQWHAKSPYCNILYTRLFVAVYKVRTVAIVDYIELTLQKMLTRRKRGRAFQGTGATAGEQALIRSLFYSNEELQVCEEGSQREEVNGDKW
jgi:hypothetical protein